MKKAIACITLLFSLITNAQYQNNYDLGAVNGNAFRFWNGSNNYKIHMGNTPVYHYGPVTDYSIKTNMNDTPGRGWTWGTLDKTPIAGLSNTGDFQIAGKFKAKTFTFLEGTSISQLASKDLRIQNANGYIDLGPKNPDWAHIYTDRPKFIFNKTIYGLNGAFSAYHTSDLKLQTNGSTKMTISRDTGNVGIGITNPDQKLDVAGNIINGGADFILGKHDGRNQGEIQQNRALVHHDADQLYINYQGDFEGGTVVDSGLKVNGNIRNEGSDFVLGKNDGRKQGDKKHNRALVHGINDELILNYDNDFEGGTVIYGRVGIGKFNPQNMLSVNGTIWAKEVKVTLNDAADYVFEEDYDLRPLTEVESYIKENKHLPEIPSADEFRKNDMKVSEMTNKLLQKIEELTLYTIAQEKELKKLNDVQKELDSQKTINTKLEARLSKIEALLTK